MQIIDVDNFSTEFRTAREENKHDVPDCATILHKKRSPNKRSKQAHHELDESRRVNKVQSFQVFLVPKNKQKHNTNTGNEYLIKLRDVLAVKVAVGISHTAKGRFVAT